MTSRARKLLDALEDGCQTRHEIFVHQGCFSLLNNAAAELRAAGIGVECVLVDGDYRYLLDERENYNPRIGPPPLPLVEQDDGQFTLDESRCDRSGRSPWKVTRPHERDRQGTHRDNEASAA